MSFQAAQQNTTYSWKNAATLLCTIYQDLPRVTKRTVLVSTTLPLQVFKLGFKDNLKRFLSTSISIFCVSCLGFGENGMFLAVPSLKLK